VRAQGVVVERAGGFEHFGGELAVGGEELLVLVEADAHGEAVDGLALGGGGQDELVAVLEEPDGFGSDGDVCFARGDLPGVLDGEAGVIVAAPAAPAAARAAQSAVILKNLYMVEIPLVYGVVRGATGLTSSA